MVKHHTPILSTTNNRMGCGSDQNNFEFYHQGILLSFLVASEPTLMVADDGEKAEHWKDDSWPAAHTPVELTNLA